MTAVGFEPTRIAPPELESGALDRSAKLSRVSGGIHFCETLAPGSSGAYVLQSLQLCAAQHWSSGYDVRLTRGRSPVQSWDEVFTAVFLAFWSDLAKKHECDCRESNPGQLDGSQLS